MELVLRRKQCGADGMNRCIAPALVIEAAGLVEVFEELAVGFASPEVEIADLKVGPDWHAWRQVVNECDKHEWFRWFAYSDSGCR